MNDQAQGLRNMVRSQHGEPARQTRVITVTSGKGGVGKSNFTLNFALALQAQGYKVVVFDADIGMANIDVLMGISARYSLYHLLKKEKTIWEIIQQGQNGIEFIAGGSGFNDLLSLPDAELDYFVQQVEQLNGYADFVFFDTGAGLSKETLKFIVAAQETIVVTTPEPTSITDAYAIIKMVHTMKYPVAFKLVVNRVADFREGKQTADKISMVAEKFLQLHIPTLGFVSDDPAVSWAVKQQVPFTVAYPGSAASKSIQQLAARFAAGQPAPEAAAAAATGVRGFLSKMMKLVR